MEEIPLPDQPPQLRVGITYNLKTHAETDVPDAEAEYDDLSTILSIKDALERNDCSVELLEATWDLPAKLAAHNVDIVFNVAEGTGGRGREAQVPALLHFYGIPFTGSDETTLCIALDKALTKRILASYHIKTPKYMVIRKAERIRVGSFVYPAIVKPNAEGSSKGISGISIVSDARQLKSVLTQSMRMYAEDILVEQYIRGREFTVGVLGNKEDARVFPPMEIVYRDAGNPHNIYSYEVKKDFGKYVTYQCPANVDSDLRIKMEDTAKKIYEILECRDFARIDFRLSEDGELYFIEINPLPGLAPGYSDYPMIAEFNGMGYSDLIKRILGAALKRYGLETVAR